MDSRDRDRERNARKEQALERILPGALAGDAAGGAASAASCPDAEILAAFYERSLAPAEVTHWRAHFAKCRLCQFSLAALAASDPRPLGEKEVARLGELVADVTVPPAAGESSPRRAKPRKIKLPWYLDLRSLAPMAAAAAFVAAIGLTIHSQRVAMMLESQNKNYAQPVFVAENRGAPAPPALQMPAPPEDSRAPAPAEAKKVSQSTARAPSASAPPYAVGVTSESEALRAESPAPAAQPAPAAPAPAAPPPAPAPAETTDRAESANGPAPGAANETAGGTPTPPSASAPADDRSASGNAPAASGAAAPAAQASAPAATVGHAASSHVRREEGLIYKSDSQEQAGAAQETVEVKKPQGYFSATSPDGEAEWRFGLRGVIEHTTNASAATANQKWTRERTPLRVDLLAGSAPSATVCWIVGRAGAILRTTDGAAWQVIASPASAERDGAAPDWVAVSARDANSATITAADGRSFVTTDAGQTWQPE